MSYTKGPWVAEFGEAYRVRSVNDMGQIAIMMNLKGAHGLGGRRTGEESAANCRLIAAAPDLLEALEIAIGHIDMASLEVSHCKDAELIRAAIKKARG